MEQNTPRNNSRRRKRTKMDMIKEAYLPSIFIGITLVLVLVFIIGAAIRKSDAPIVEAPVPSSTAPQVDMAALQQEAQQRLQQAQAQAENYDFEAAVATLEGFSGDSSLFPDLISRRDEYRHALSTLVTWSDPSQITCLSFHMLIAKPEIAFADQSYGTAYNRNFVTTEEFNKILQQLYDNGYVLVRLSDFSSVTTNEGNTVAAAKPLQLPAGKKPLVLVQTNLSYYKYMSGGGFANRLWVDDNGNFTSVCATPSQGGEATYGMYTGDYDLVPILESFIKQNPTFSYKGARAVLAPSGYDGILGYRINAGAKVTLGEEAYAQECANAKTVVEALRSAGYELACYSYGNSNYGNLGAAEIQADLQKWAAEIEPIMGKTDVLVFAQGADIGTYDGTKFNVLQNAGFRYYLGFSSAGVGGNHIALRRILVTGSEMAHNGGRFAGLFDPQQVLDPLRGTVPQ